MATYKRRKGFNRKEGHHVFFDFYTETGEKTRVWTKTSHGRGSADIDRRLFTRIA